MSAAKYEEGEHIAFVEWLILHAKRQRFRFHHSPNGGERVKRQDRHGNWYSPGANRLKAMGCSPGFPDIIIIPEKGSGLPHVVIEMKRKKEKGSAVTVTQEQSDWLSHFLWAGWDAKVCHGALEAIEFCQTLGYGKR